MRKQITTNFLNHLKNHSYKKAYACLTYSWKSRKENTIDKFIGIFGSRDIKAFDFIKEEKINDVVYDIYYYLKYNIAGKSFKDINIIRVICETKAYKADIKGQWLVNPISALRYNE